MYSDYLLVYFHFILDPEVGVAGFREVLGPQARKRSPEGTQL
jgi:hypothetical protein